MVSERGRWLYLSFFIICSYGAGAVGALFTVRSVESWYSTLIKTPLTPPDATFSIVWPVLYGLMAVAMYRVHRRASLNKVSLLTGVFLVHLALNALWSVVFFGYQDPIAALGILLLLIGFVVFLVYTFGKVDRVARWMLVPYLFWLFFALYLNIGIVILN